MKRIFAAALSAFALSGCIEMGPRPDSPAYAPVYVPAAPLAATEAGALYRPGVGLSLFDDRRALNIGDVVTIALEERFQSSKSSQTSVKKGSETGIAEPDAFGGLLKHVTGTAGISTSLSSNTDFTGEAGADQSNSLSGTVSVTVTDVMPNGLMVVQGEKWLTLNRGEEVIRVSGLLRPNDVGPDNTVSSRRLANARITYSGRGELADANSMGWFTRFFVSPLWPF